MEMDYNLLRELDRPYVRQVVAFLEDRNLEVQLEGSATRGDKQYRDIDLLASGSLDAVMKGIAGLQRDHPLLSKPFPESAENGRLYAVQPRGGPFSYVSTLVDYRFEIRVGDTIMDVCLKVDPQADETEAQLGALTALWETIEREVDGLGEAMRNYDRSLHEQMTGATRETDAVSDRIEGMVQESREQRGNSNRKKLD